MELLCNTCRQGGYLTVSAPCSQCKNQTASEFQLCQTCALRKDQCQKCLTKLDAGFTADDLAAVDKAQSVYDTAVAAAETVFAAAFEPLKEAVSSFTKADEEAHASLRLATKDTDEACTRTGAELQTAKTSRKDVATAQKAFDDACALARQTREAARVIYLQSGVAVDAQYGTQREQYASAQDARNKATTKAEHKYEAMVQLVIQRRLLEQGYLAEIKRIEALQ